MSKNLAWLLLLLPAGLVFFLLYRRLAASGRGSAIRVPTGGGVATATGGASPAKTGTASAAAFRGLGGWLPASIAKPGFRNTQDGSGFSLDFSKWADKFVFKPAQNLFDHLFDPKGKGQALTDAINADKANFNEVQANAFGFGDQANFGMNEYGDYTLPGAAGSNFEQTGNTDLTPFDPTGFNATPVDGSVGPDATGNNFSGLDTTGNNYSGADASANDYTGMDFSPSGGDFSGFDFESQAPAWQTT